MMDSSLRIDVPTLNDDPVDLERLFALNYISVRRTAVSSK